MSTVWFALISLMLATYVVLDGFDFGAGILHLIVAKTEQERRMVLASIGPVWDGNEVWLIASGGVLVFAFPRVYAAGFSGFYLPLMMSLWLLIIRGLSIEFRSQSPNVLWRSFWDGGFFVSSALMAIILGAALGNVIRGVPIDAAGYFSGPLFTNFLPGMHPGVLDWYTVLIGAFTLAVLAAHGACYLVWKTSGPVNARAAALVRPLWTATAALLAAATGATDMVRPAFYGGLAARPWIWLLVAGFLTCLAAVVAFSARSRERDAFLASAGFIALLLAATAACHYPSMLYSTLTSAYNLTAANSSTGTAGLTTGLVWWSIAIVLAVGYFTYLFRSFSGKAAPTEHGHGY